MNKKHKSLREDQLGEKKTWKKRNYLERREELIFLIRYIQPIYTSNITREYGSM